MKLKHVMLVSMLGFHAIGRAETIQESQKVRATFQQVLDAVASGWFGKPYQDMNALDLKGNLTLVVSPQMINAKVDQLSRGGAKGALTQSALVKLNLSGTYFANGDFRTEMSGDFGNLVYTRIGNRGFLYSREQNAYTTKIDPPPPGAPLSYMGWFRQVLNDIKAVYVDNTTFKATYGKEEASSGKPLQTVVFATPTVPYDPKKREQSMSDTLGFWKQGRLELTIDKTSKLPRKLSFLNEAQGVNILMNFQYQPDGRLQLVDMLNQSRGAQGPAALRVTYGTEGLISHISGRLDNQRQGFVFDMDLGWSKGKAPTSLVSVPPPGAVKKGGEEMKTMLAVGLAGRILDLQRKGLNLRSVTLGNP